MRIFQRILLAGTRHWPFLVFGFLSMLLSGVVSAWPSLVFKTIFDILSSGKLTSSSVAVQLIPSQLQQFGFYPINLTLNPQRILSYIPLFLVCLFSLDGVFNFVSVFFTRYFGVLVSNDLREQAHRKILNLSLKQLRGRSSGDLVSCLTNDLTLLQSLLAEVLTALVKDSATAIALCVWLLITDWKLSLFGGTVLPVFFFFISKLAKKLRKLANQGQKVTGEIAGFVSESVQGFDLINLFNIQNSRQAQFEERSKIYRRVWRKQLITDASIGPMMGIVASLTIGCIIWFGLNQVFIGNKTIGDFSSYIIAVVLLYQPLKRLSRVQAQINQITGNVGRLFDLLDEEPEMELHEMDKFRFSEPLSIKFENVGFWYSPEQKVLKGINLTIQDGEQVALVGSSGGGKSSLIKLIPRLYEATEGKLSVCGQDVKSWNLSELRSLISFVPQDPFLFSGTLKENLLIAKPRATDDELQHALALAKVDFLHLIEKGIDGQVGERGLNLSGGQRQRIGIARAFLKDSPILILDEPTSSLDQHSEELIRQSIEVLRKNRTVIIVTHKLGSVKNFDRIVCIQEGRIVEEGKPADLLKIKGTYYQLMQSAL